MLTILLPANPIDTQIAVVSNPSNHLTENIGAAGLSAQEINTQTAAVFDSLNPPNRHVGAAASGEQGRFRSLV